MLTDEFMFTTVSGLLFNFCLISFKEMPKFEVSHCSAFVSRALAIGTIDMPFGNECGSDGLSFGIVGVGFGGVLSTSIADRLGNTNATEVEVRVSVICAG